MKFLFNDPEVLSEGTLLEWTCSPKHLSQFFTAFYSVYSAPRGPSARENWIPQCADQVCAKCQKWFFHLRAKIPSNILDHFNLKSSLQTTWIQTAETGLRNSVKYLTELGNIQSKRVQIQGIGPERDSRIQLSVLFFFYGKQSRAVLDPLMWLSYCIVSTVQHRRTTTFFSVLSERIASPAISVQLWPNFHGRPIDVSRI